jgi:hypothetical protein
VRYRVNLPERIPRPFQLIHSPRRAKALGEIQQIDDRLKNSHSHDAGRTKRGSSSIRVKLRFW